MSGLKCSFHIHSDWHNNETMSEKMGWLLASYQWLLCIYLHLMVPYANTCQMLSKAYTTFTPFPALSCVWRGEWGFSMTYGVTLLHTKEAYLH
jgi:hypothetical protein